MVKQEVYNKYLNNVILGDKIVNEQDFFANPIYNFDISETENIITNDLYYLAYIYRKNILIPFVFYERNVFEKSSGNLKYLKSDWYINE
ncbi:MAG: hypothetical protein R3Y35_12555 [Clostridia bacterium]